MLADARHDQPLPDDVAARLDAVLERLGEEEPDRSGGTVTHLAARRRAARGLLLAAAAVVVVGVGVGQLVGTGSDSGGDATSAAAEAYDDSAAAGSAESADEGAAQDDLESAREQSSAGESSLDASGTDDQVAPLTAQSEEQVARLAQRPPVRLTSDGFSRQVARLRVRPGLVSTDDQVVNGSDLSTSESFTCPPAVWGAGSLLAARYDGSPTVLAYRPPSGDTQVVDLLQCGSGEVVRSVVLPG
ncbi:MAG: hypothetical protein CMH83_15460 [Nocardioides sp.]|nr:hypothetical protein [Nocardioides sp.]